MTTHLQLLSRFRISGVTQGGADPTDTLCHDMSRNVSVGSAPPCTSNSPPYAFVVRADTKLSFIFTFHSRTVRLDIIKVFIHQLRHKKIALKGVLKFTLKQLQHVSV